MDLPSFTSIADSLSSKLGLNSTKNTIGNNNANNNVASAQPPSGTPDNVASQLSGYQVFSYPTELGTNRYPYYMVFYINTQSRATLSGSNSTVPNSQAVATQNKVRNAVTTSTQANPNPVTSKFVNPTKRTTIALALPMPNELAMHSGAEYTTVSPGVLGTNLEAALNGEVLQLLKNAGQTIIQDIPKFIGNVADELLGTQGSGDMMKQLALKVSGRALNERREQMFKGMNSRTFNFNWTLIPRTQAESIYIHEIIKQLRYNQHPEVDISSSGNTHGLNMIIPNEFDLEFHFKGDQMTGIPKISTCYLADVQVNYTPLQKWVAFDGTDNPVATHLSVTFTEIEPLTREMIERGY